MANFDVAVAISQEELTALSQEFYTAVYPQAFTGNFSCPYEGTNFTVFWDVKAAPVFVLESSAEAKAAVVRHLSEQIIATNIQGFKPQSPNAFPQPLKPLTEKAVSTFLPVFPDKAQGAVTSYIKELVRTGNTQILEPSHISAFVERRIANCSVRLPEVVLTIKTPGMRDASLTLDATAYCFAQITNNQITLVSVAITAAQQADPLYDLLVQKFLLPELHSLLSSHLANLSLPPIDIEGVLLSPISIVIEGGHIVAAANLAKKGVPPQPYGTFWTEAGLSVLLSQDALQAAAAYGISQLNASSSLHDKGEEEDWGFGYYWGYSCSLGTPDVALSGTDLHVTLPVNASVWGGGIVFWVHIGVDYQALFEPTPQPVFSIAASGNSIEVTFKSMNTVVVMLEPTGGVAEEIVGWMLAGIVNAVSASFSTIFTTFVKNIKFPLITVPSFSPTIEGVKFTVTPSDLSLSNLEGMLAIGGDMTVSKR